MRSGTLLSILLSAAPVLGWSTVVLGQQGAPPATPKPGAAAEAESEAEAEPDTAAATEDEEPASEAEQAADAEADAAASAGESAEAGAQAPELPEPSPMLPPAEPEPMVPSPSDLEERLAQEVPEGFAGDDDWTAPAPVLTLHGYMRMRGELMDTFWLGRTALDDFRATAIDREETNGAMNVKVGQGPDPFSRFRPLERRRVLGTERAPEGLSCVDESTNRDGTCEVDTLQFANMRLRLSPQFNLSEDVRVKMTFDVFDNIIAGQTPASFYGVPDPMEDARVSAEDSVFASTDVSDTIKARRAWGEVRNRNLGELRFGRMPQHWGLGMYYNAGDGIDQDYSTDLDRVLGITKLAGLYLSASYDFIAEGVFDSGRYPNLDVSQLDDVDQFTLSVAKRHTPEELTSDIERGELVLNGGLQFSIRNQDSLYVPLRVRDDEDGSPLDRVEATHYTTDLWGLLRYRGLRVEAEVAWVTGGMDNFIEDSGELDISQLGYAIETELRLVNDQLGLYFYHGLASGDNDVEGLSADADYLNQLGNHDDTISTFRFHPSYQIDLIMWRNIMRQVTGAWYIKPGISYDFLRGDFGQLFGARLDVVYSRATAFIQTWGNDPDLGLEVNASIYWRSEDGPDLDDGYHAQLQYGVLFPMRGLGYYHEDTDLDTAQTLRLLLGVVF